MKQVTIFFDYESTWGMPQKRPYDLIGTTKALLEVLDRHGAVAAFNTTGRIVESHPSLIKRIHRAGHEISIHGYSHTNPAHMTAADNAQFDSDLHRVETALVPLIGGRPLGFRSPHLGAPRFYDPATYAIFERHGYAWASNREVLFIDEATSPRVRARRDIVGLTGRIIHTLRLEHIGFVRTLSYLALNARLLLSDRPGHSLVSNVHWLLRRPAPFERAEMTEIPVLSPLDCDFLGDQINPADPTPADQLEHMVASLCREFDNAHGYFNLNFHDWIIGTSNRLQILDRVLAYINASGRAQWVLPRTLIAEPSLAPGSAPVSKAK